VAYIASPLDIFVAAILIDIQVFMRKGHLFHVVRREEKTRKQREKRKRKGDENREKNERREPREEKKRTKGGRE
jgi:hypothetical protein